MRRDIRGPVTHSRKVYKPSACGDQLVAWRCVEIVIQKHLYFLRTED